MKLLIIYHSGLADDAKYIFREFAAQGVDLTVIVPQRNGPLVYAPKVNEPGFTYTPLSFKTSFDFLGILKTIKKVNPDVIHVIDEYTSFSLFETIVCRNILRIVGFKKIPIFSLSFQNLPLISPPFNFKSPVAFFKRILHKILFPLMVWYHKRNLDGIVVGNSEASKILLDLGVSVSMKHIFWGVNMQLFFPKDQNECRDKLGIPKEVKVIGYFGKILKEKGLENLVRATSQLTDYHLLLVGNGSYKKELLDIIADVKIQNRVHFYDSVKLNELVDYYNCLDAYVLPTYTAPNCREQYGRVLVEAMACRIPVIGSSCGAIPEVLKGYPRHVIFNEYSLPDLVSKIKEIETFPKLDNFDTQKFLHKFSIENFVSENLKFYRHD